MKPEFTVPPPIIDAIEKGLHDMSFNPPRHHPEWGFHGHPAQKLWLKTDSGDVLTFLRGPEMGP